MGLPLRHTLYFYDSSALLYWLEAEYSIDKDAFWEWLCADSMSDVRNDSYGEWYIDDWIEYPEENPAIVSEIAHIIKNKLNVRESITVRYCW